ncbi:MAG: hypothetical protein ACRDHL_09285 [Candidatus Promineifilaceae bacterium]
MQAKTMLGRPRNNDPPAGDLRRLLEQLELGPGLPLTLEPLQQLREQAPDAPVPEALQETIRLARSLADRSRDFRLSGLFEFQLALILLEAGRFRPAAERFEQAARQWRLLSRRDLPLLADFAQGLALQQAHDYEGATDLCVAVQQAIEAAEERAGRGSSEEEAGAELRFLRQLRLRLVEAAEQLKGELRRTGAETLPAGEAIAPPIIKDALK